LHIWLESLSISGKSGAKFQRAALATFFRTPGSRYIIDFHHCADEKVFASHPDNVDPPSQRKQLMPQILQQYFDNVFEVV
jgi:hypothetical protein